LLLLASLAVGAALSTPARAAELRAGVGNEEITPPVGTPLSGYAARKGAASTGVHDPVFAKALVLDDGTTRLAILTVDLIGCDPAIVQAVAARSGFPPEQLMVCASHTHSGPGAFSKSAFAQIVGGAYVEPVREQLVAGMARAVTQAVASLQPARLAAGERELPGFQRNRRKASITDPALWVLRVDTARGRPLAALVNLTAHGTVLDEKSLEISGDWMGFTQAWIQKEVPGLTALYANGAEGDISPNLSPGSQGFSAAQEHGERGGREALKLYRKLKPRRSARLSVRTAMLDLPRTFKAGLLGASARTMLQCMTIGDSVLIAVPGEMITRLGLLLKEHARRQGAAHGVIMGLANDHLGYLLTRAEMKKGGYEAGVSFFGDEFGETLTLELGKLVGGELPPLEAGLKAANEGPAPR
jgi:hypothetical protein